MHYQISKILQERHYLKFYVNDINLNLGLFQFMLTTQDIYQLKR